MFFFTVSQSGLTCFVIVFCNYLSICLPYNLHLNKFKVALLVQKLTRGFSEIKQNKDSNLGAQNKRIRILHGRFWMNQSGKDVDSSLRLTVTKYEKEVLCAVTGN